MPTLYTQNDARPAPAQWEALIRAGVTEEVMVGDVGWRDNGSTDAMAASLHLEIPFPLVYDEGEWFSVAQFLGCNGTLPVSE